MGISNKYGRPVRLPKNIRSLLSYLITLVTVFVLTANSIVSYGDEDEVAIPTLTIKERHINLNGMDIIIRDWSTHTPDPSEPRNDFEEAQAEWRDWGQEVYNFTVHRYTVFDRDSSVQDFVDYVNAGGDENNYAFILPNVPAVMEAMKEGLFYDLSTLDSRELGDIKTPEQCTFAGHKYGISPGFSNTRTGLYFNYDILTDSGISPDDIYDLQARGEWTWAEFDRIMNLCQRDITGDGIDDIYGLCCDEAAMATQAVFSNNGSLFNMSSNSKYSYNLESDETLEALRWIKDIYGKYNSHTPVDADSDCYRAEFLSGRAAFMFEQELITDDETGNLPNDVPFEYGYVMFPKGPKADDYVFMGSSDIIAIPACYDAEKA